MMVEHARDRRTLGVARSTIRTIWLGQRSGARLPLAGDLTTTFSKTAVFEAGFVPGSPATNTDWSALAREIKRPGVNLMVCEEYREAHPDAMATSRFCDLFREFDGGVTGDAQHHCRDKLFVDYSAEDLHRRRNDR